MTDQLEAQDAANEEVRLLREIRDNTATLVDQGNLLVDLSESIDDTLSAILSLLTPTMGATHGVITFQGGTVPGQITVDQDGNATLGFADDHGNPTGPPPGDGSGIVVTFAVDDPALATVGATSPSTDANGNATFTAQIVPVGPVGVVNVSAPATNTSGVTPVLDADGVTTFVDASPFALTLVAGQAADGELSVGPA
jgi:hypothetical protein